ncbi:Na+/H+ antiporter subunit E [Chelatococcus asaccharovorans]|uniref:Na+/H+ antiporter subunit E n=1 Tax=Chelatococcus asaccharovorans TaxID=28210 RepID=UPI00224C6F5A|nr:Na+/H+ antiporter subunit E [Chelatococcus asaccharovorans]CAH1659154.1 Multicomponent Na+:H+ antiporter subunit E [Chelatococcus asaccharovorans]CAH1688136.1 Multicomponent Na+:H+ antiporter subunit E [Chelatococcus asaccharovorans]
MMTTTTPDARTSRSGLILRGTGFLILWMILIGPAPKDLAVGLVAAVAATWTSTALWPAGARLSIPGIMRFLMRFLMQSVVAGIDVAWRAVTTPPAVAPGFVTFRTALPAGMIRATATAIMSLQPGKLPVASEPDGTLLIHCLDLREPVAQQLAADEAAFCRTMTDGGHHG